MKILLHGATNKENFGDFLFAYMFYNELKKQNEVSFFESKLFGINNFYRKYLGYDKHESRKSQLNKDLLVYISGGYLGEKKKSNLKSIIRYYRYFWIGEKYIKKGKDVVFVGLGGSPIYNKLLRNKIIKIMKASKLIIVRDEKTKDYYEKYGVENIISTSDTVLSLNCNTVLNNSGYKDNKELVNKKVLLLHIYGSKNLDQKIIEKVVPAINKFLQDKKDWHIVITNDNTLQKKYDVNKVLDKIDCANKKYIKYENPFELLNIINNSSLVITPKLHVGIVSSLLNKSVLSYPIDYNKTSRFYNQINEKDRCISLKDINQSQAYDMINSFYDKKIVIEKNIISLACKNLELLNNYIDRK